MLFILTPGGFEGAIMHMAPPPAATGGRHASVRIAANGREILELAT